MRSALIPNLPVVAIVIPNVGELSRKERDDLQACCIRELAQQTLKIFDDSKRLEKSYPEAVAKVRELSGPGENDLHRPRCRRSSRRRREDRPALKGSQRFGRDRP